MLENRIKVVNARMIDIDRGDKNIVLHNKVVPYDTLILTMGLQDKILSSMGYVSRGIAPIPEDKKRMEGILSIDDPFLYQHLRKDGTLIQMLTNRKKPERTVIYGRAIHAYCLIQGLLQRGVQPKNISVVIPDSSCHLEDTYKDNMEEMMIDLPIINPDAFEDEYIETKIQGMIEEMGVIIYRKCLLLRLDEDENNRLKRAVFKKLDAPAIIQEEEEEEMEDEGEDGEGEGDEGEDEYRRKKRKKHDREIIDCRLLVTAGHRDVDPDVFNAIHNNGLVYNGRLIVDKNFQTTDPSIFAAGSLCEFSGRYKALSQGKPLRLDRFNGREMGSRLARSVFDIYDPTISAAVHDQSSLSEDELPTFFLPQGLGGRIPGGLNYYYIKTTTPLIMKEGDQVNKNRKDLMCDNIGETGKGHFIKFTMNQIGLIDSVTYIGDEDIIVQSLWSFVGLHENYLNRLTIRFENGIIPNVVEFLSENWAMALYHEWFGDFCLRMRQSIHGMKDIQ